MLGAIIGDLAGSVYEFDQYKKIRKIELKNIIDDDAFFSDDTILTIAIADAILCGGGNLYKNKLKEYAKKYMNLIPQNVPYFKKMFSPDFEKWTYGDFQGSSNGNGAMMRISPVGEMFLSKEEVLKNTYLAISPSHNNEDAIKYASLVALIIFYSSRCGMKREEIIKELNIEIKKPDIKNFNYTCNDTIDVCLYSVFNSNSFEESIKLAISFGGDTDTNACIVGSMAEAIFGIPEYLKTWALEKLPAEFIEIIERFERAKEDNAKQAKLK